MCELLGFSASAAADIGEYLDEFFKHSEKNPHGFGLMLGDDRKIIKEPVKATDSEVLRKTLGGINKQKTVLAHIRFATVGSVDSANCHPFSLCDSSGREWTMIHNGTIYTGRSTYKYFKVQKGDTDSERLFLAFIDEMNAHLAKGELTDRQRFDVVDEFVAHHSPRNKLNLIFYDGEYMYVHQNMKNTLGITKLDDGVLITTAPVCDKEWTPLPMTQLIAYKDGKELFRGSKHEGEFIPNLEYITALDAMNI